MEWTFFTTLGIIEIPLLTIACMTWFVPFVNILGKESALFVSNKIKRFSLQTSASYRLAMLAAVQQPERWNIKSLRELSHPEVGNITRSNNSNHCHIGFQAIPKWQFDKVYQTVLDGQAMAKLRELNESTRKRLKQLTTGVQSQNV